MTRKESIQLFIETFNNFYNPEYFKDTNGRKYLSYTQNQIIKTIAIKSDAVKNLVISIFKEKKLGDFNKHITEEIIDQLESNAYMSEITKEVFLRFGQDVDDNVIVDLVDNGYCIIGSDGFQLAKSVSTPFHRSQKMLSLPVPRKVNIDVFLDKFKSKFNFENPNDYILVLTFIIKSLVPKSGANPILILQGLQGTGKTTASKIIKNLIDPTHPLLFAPPGNITDIIVTANSSHLLAFDNLSGLNGEMTDLFCRISSGGGHKKGIIFGR